MSVIARPRTGEVVSVEPTVKRVRVMFGGEVVADSHRTLILFEQGHLPVYYFPLEDVREDLLEPSEKHTTCPRKGEAAYWTLRVGERVVEDVMWGYDEPLDSIPEIAGHRVEGHRQLAQYPLSAKSGPVVPCHESWMACGCARCGRGSDKPSVTHPAAFRAVRVFGGDPARGLIRIRVDPPLG